MRKLYNLAVLIIDILLFVMIIRSVNAKEEAQAAGPAEPAAYAVMPESYDIAEPDDDSSTDIYDEEPQETAPSYTEETAISDSGEGAEEPQTGTGQDDSAQGLEQFILGETEPDPSVPSDVSQGDFSPEMPADGYEEYMGMEDFDWYTSNVSLNWFPEEAVPFSEFQRMKGRWRAYIKFDPNNEAGRRQDLLLHIYISGDEDNVTAEYDWYWYRLHNEAEGSYDDSDNSYYYGTYRDGEIHGEGAGSVDFRYFYEWDGEEYAIGVMQSQAGVKAILCMMR